MKVLPTGLPGVLLIEPRVFDDARGFFLETWNLARYESHGIPHTFVQDNVSRSSKGVLRGLHFQHPHGQGKLVYVLEGAVLDVAVDIRRGSPTFKHWYGEILSEENNRQLFIPPGFAHGFSVLSESVLFAYKCTEFYNPDTDGGILWSDPDLGIDWQVESPILSSKDQGLPRLRDLPENRLPLFEGE